MYRKDLESPKNIRLYKEDYSVKKGKYELRIQTGITLSFVLLAVPLYWNFLLVPMIIIGGGLLAILLKTVNRWENKNEVKKRRALRDLWFPLTVTFFAIDCLVAFAGVKFNDDSSLFNGIYFVAYLFLVIGCNNFFVKVYNKMVK